MSINTNVNTYDDKKTLEVRINGSVLNESALRMFKVKVRHSLRLLMEEHTASMRELCNELITDSYLDDFYKSYMKSWVDEPKWSLPDSDGSIVLAHQSMHHDCLQMCIKDITLVHFLSVRACEVCDEAVSGLNMWKPCKDDYEFRAPETLNKLKS